MNVTITQAVKAIERLSTLQKKILLHAHQLPGPSIAYLRDLIGSSPASTSRALRRLERRGLILTTSRSGSYRYVIPTALGKTGADLIVMRLLKAKKVEGGYFPVEIPKEGRKNEGQ